MNIDEAVEKLMTKGSKR